MPMAEGLALYSAGLSAASIGPLLEIGSYCGKSAIYLGAAARERGTILFSIDHHRGSEEQQRGEQFHDPDLVDANQRVDTLPCFREAITDAGLEDVVLSIVGRSEVVAGNWATSLGLVFIDGGHSQAATDADYGAWSDRLRLGGLLAIHDVFPDPEDGGRPPYLIYLRALESGSYEPAGEEGSLRILRRIS
jgi:MMP 1-O-methyltransferase